MTAPHRTLIARGGVAALAVTCLCTWIVGCASDSDGAASTTAVPKAATTAAPAAAKPNQVDVDLVDYGFDGPSSVPAGVTTFTVHDTSKDQQHELQLARLNDGVTWDQVEETLHGAVPEAVSGMVTMVGGVGPVEADGTSSTTVDLEEGSYGMLCFITGFDGKSHLAHGMAKPLDVTAAKGDAAPTPKAKGDIVLADMTVTLPDGFDGTGTWHVVNDGPQVHQAAIMKLADGATRKDLDAYLASTAAPTGPPPATVVGGAGAIAKGEDEWLDLDLAKGNYVFICFVPDTTKGFMPHFMEGMLTEYEQT